MGAMLTTGPAFSSFAAPAGRLTAAGLIQPAGDRRPPLVFVHGVLASPGFWLSGLPETLTAGRRWASLALPGHFPARAAPGFKASELTPDLWTAYFEAALDASFPEEPVVFVGHSTGGFAALHMAVARPHRVAAAVSIAGFADGRFHGAEGVLQRLAGSGPVGRAAFALCFRLWTLSPGLYGAGARTLVRDRSAFAQFPGLADAAERVWRDVRRNDPYGLASVLEAIRGINALERFRTLDRPALLIAGGEDPVIPPAHARLLAASLPQAQYVEIPDAGHMPFVERPEVFAAALSPFIRSVDEDMRKSLIVSSDATLATKSASAGERK